MRSFQKITEDVKRGDNIDLYVLVTAAVIVAALNLLSIPSQNLITTITLSLFALIAIAMLGLRHQLEEIQSKLGDSTATKIIEKYPREQMNDDMMRASEIWLFGVHLVGLLRYHRETIEDHIKQGRIIRVLVVDPNGHACAMAAARNPGNANLMVARERASIVATLDDLCELKQIAPDKCEIKIIDDPLMYGGCLIDPDRPSAKIYIHRYSYQTGVRPRFIWKRNDEWFGFLKSELDSLWNIAKVFECKSSNTNNKAG